MQPDGSELPEMIGRAREYAYIGKYEDAIRGFHECVKRLEK